MSAVAYDLYDMHCHLDLMANAAQVAREAAAQGLALFGATVTPDNYKYTAKELLEEPNVRMGVGLHPWWIADGRCGLEEIDEAEDLAFSTRFVGEIGLDYSPAHADPDSYARQWCALEKLTRACAEGAMKSGRKVLSIHAVRSAGRVLDALEQTECLDRCDCIFHWFSGTSNELHRAVTAGCWFSVNEMMLRTKRGREYARQVPERQLLLETDLPPEEDKPFSADEIVASLERTLAQLKELRGHDVRATTSANAQSLLEL